MIDLQKLKSDKSPKTCLAFFSVENLSKETTVTFAFKLHKILVSCLPIKPVPPVIIIFLFLNFFKFA